MKMDYLDKPNRVKLKIKEGKPIICAFMRIPDPSIAEIMALCGVELIVLDCEHYQFDPEKLVNIIRAADIYDVSCLARVTYADLGQICRLLDMGAAGILLTDVEDASQVRDIVGAVKYAPIGRRGVSTDSRGNRFGFLVDKWKHASFSNDNTIIAVVIETKSAVADLDKILAIPEVDMLSVGSADLSLAYGMPGELENPKMKDLKASIYSRIVLSGKMALDKVSTVEEAEKALTLGIKCFYIASDAALLRDSLKGMIDPLKNR